MHARFDVSKFNAYLDDLSGTLRVSREQVIRAEVGSVLKLWVLRTKVTPANRLDYRGRRDAVWMARRVVYGGSGKASDLRPGQAWVTMGKPGTPPLRLWKWNRKSRSFFLLSGPGAPRPTDPSRLSAPKARMLFGIAQTQMPTSVKSARQSSGLSRQSVVQIADSLRIKLETVPGGRSVGKAVAKAREALASDGNYYQNGVGVEILDAHKFIARLINRIPWARSPLIKMDATLASILKGRIKYFSNNVAHGVFKQAAGAARAYPGIRVTHPPKIDA
jgi:hypothetical protein